MSDTNEKGAFQADIPANAVEEALRSVERVVQGEAPPPEVAVVVEPVAEGGSDGAELASLRAQLELSQAKGRESASSARPPTSRTTRSGRRRSARRSRSSASRRC
jgi:molecular chaperone GrpE